MSYPDYAIDLQIQSDKFESPEEEDYFRGVPSRKEIDLNKCMVCGKTLRTQLDKAVGECKQCREGE